VNAARSVCAIYALSSGGAGAVCLHVRAEAVMLTRRTGWFSGVEATVDPPVRRPCTTWPALCSSPQGQHSSHCWRYVKYKKWYGS